MFHGSLLAIVASGEPDKIEHSGLSIWQPAWIVNMRNVKVLSGSRLHLRHMIPGVRPCPSQPDVAAVSNTISSAALRVVDSCTDTPHMAEARRVVVSGSGPAWSVGAPRAAPDTLAFTRRSRPEFVAFFLRGSWQRVGSSINLVPALLPSDSDARPPNRTCTFRYGSGSADTDVNRNTHPFSSKAFQRSAKRGNCPTWPSRVTSRG